MRFLEQAIGKGTGVVELREIAKTFSKGDGEEGGTALKGGQ
jgi:hypothetical protein